ncbi:MAG: hypothetical protein KJN90_09060, partial [Gammaproteobacteria bacterium]|nr:hypothetical protein [Gammaproteobacteria bacterium]
MHFLSLVFLKKIKVFSKTGIILLVILHFSAGTTVEETLTDNIPAPEMALIPGASIEIGSLIDYRAQPIHRVE